MLERIGDATGMMADRVSRRAALGRLGVGAAALAGLLADVVAGTAVAQAGTFVCCKYECTRYCGNRYQYSCHAAGTACPPGFSDRVCICRLVKQSDVKSCSRCR